MSELINFYSRNYIQSKGEQTINAENNRKYTKIEPLYDGSALDAN